MTRANQSDPRSLATTVAAAAILLLSAPALLAQSTLSDADREFVKTAAESSAAEVSMGKSAAESKNQAVADFGKQMIHEHTQMNDELAALAKGKGVEPPSSPDAASMAKGAVTSVLPGQAFDSQYISSQLDDHKETLALLQKQAQSGGDPELKAFAAKYVPVVQKHIDELTVLQRQPDVRQ